MNTELLYTFILVIVSIALIIGLTYVFTKYPNSKKIAMEVAKNAPLVFAVTDSIVKSSVKDEKVIANFQTFKEIANSAVKSVEQLALRDDGVFYSSEEKVTLALKTFKELCKVSKIDTSLIGEDVIKALIEAAVFSIK